MCLTLNQLSREIFRGLDCAPRESCRVLETFPPQDLVWQRRKLEQDSCDSVRGGSSDNAFVLFDFCDFARPLVA